MRNRPRWSKVLSDLSGSKTRTLLVVLSIAVGVFAVGLVADTYLILINSSNTGYARINPSSVFIIVSDFDQELVEIVKKMPQVAEADGRRVTTIRLNLGGNWYASQLSGRDFDEWRLNQIDSTGGLPVPDDRQLLIDQTAYFLTDFDIGDMAIVEMPDGRRYEMPVVGTVRDLNSNPSINSGAINAYTTLETFPWLGEPAANNRLTFTTVEKQTDYDHILDVTARVKDKIEKSGWQVFGSIIFPEPGVSPVNFIIEALRFVLGVMAVASLILSVFLVFNTMSALIVAQVKQIGIMKSVGASTLDLMIMYLVLVVTYGILAFAIAVGPAAWAAYSFSQFIGSPRMLDLDLLSFQYRPSIIALELFISIIVPILGALPAVYSGTKTSVHEAISTHGLADNFGSNALDRLLGHARSITGPWILSMGNVLRNKRRVILTLGTLILGGGVFIGVISVKASADKTVAELGQAYRFDVEVQFPRPYRTEQIVQDVLQVPGVEAAEGWLSIGGSLVNKSGEDGNTMQILAPPPGTILTRPKLVEGRWLLPEDENAIVVDSSLLREDPSLSVGDSIRLKINGREYDWTIVGVYQFLGINFVYVGYANYPYVAEVVGDPGQSRRLQIVTTRHDPDFQAEMAERISEHFKEKGIRVSAVDTSSALKNVQVEQFNIVVVVLIMMALLISLVGGLGLAGTMSMSVLERTREIGVMRVVGAEDGMLVRIIIVEGLLMALLSWVAAIVFAWPIGVLMSRFIGRDLVNGPLSYAYSIPGAVLWLLLVILTAILASYMPARRASNLAVRDVLAYE